jgi:hypothetical protein
MTTEFLPTTATTPELLRAAYAAMREYCRRTNADPQIFAIFNPTLNKLDALQARRQAEADEAVKGGS